MDTNRKSVRTRRAKIRSKFMNDFTRGFGSVLSVGGISCSRKTGSFKSDSLALASDWKRVGSYISHGIRETALK